MKNNALLCRNHFYGFLCVTDKYFLCLPLILKKLRASLVAQWLRIRLPMQGTLFQALVWEDPTYRGATKPVLHNY